MALHELDYEWQHYERAWKETEEKKGETLYKLRRMLTVLHEQLMLATNQLEESGKWNKQSEERREYIRQQINHLLNPFLQK